MDKVYKDAKKRYNERKYEEALNLVNKYLDNNNCRDGYNLKSLILKELSRYKEALLCVNIAINNFKDKDENYLEKILSKAEILFHLEDYEEALKCYNMCIENNCDNPGVFTGIGHTLYKLERYDEALSYLNGLEKNGEILNLKALCLYCLKNTQMP